jgi:hypothetical protein
MPEGESVASPMVDRRGVVIGVNDAYRMSTASGTPTELTHDAPLGHRRLGSGRWRGERLALRGQR